MKRVILPVIAAMLLCGLALLPGTAYGNAFTAQQIGGTGTGIGTSTVPGGQWVFKDVGIAVVTNDFSYTPALGTTYTGATGIFKAIQDGFHYTATRPVPAGWNNWSGTTGIKSLRGSTSPAVYAIGYLPAAAISPPMTNWAGYPFTPTVAPAASATTLIRETWVGDANLDGKVNYSDYQWWKSGYIYPATHGGSNYAPELAWQYGDFDYNGITEYRDYLLWKTCYVGRAYYNEDVVSASGGAGDSLSAVPEPATWGLLAAAVVCGLVWKLRVRLPR